MEPESSCDSFTAASPFEISQSFFNHVLDHAQITRSSSRVIGKARGTLKLRHLLAFLKAPLSTQIRCRVNLFGSVSLCPIGDSILFKSVLTARHGDGAHTSVLEKKSAGELQ
jgi:hypothetical protein